MPVEFEHLWEHEHIYQRCNVQPFVLKEVRKGVRKCVRKHVRKHLRKGVHRGVRKNCFS